MINYRLRGTYETRSSDRTCDEGGFAPEIDLPEDVLATLVEAIDDAGYRVGRDRVAIAIDPAASEFYRDGVYRVAGDSLSSDEMIARYAEILDRFPVWSLEDGLAEDDWDGWERLTGTLGERVQIVGDDSLVTTRRSSPRRLADTSGTLR